jgi:hypothetical protein
MPRGEGKVDTAAAQSTSRGRGLRGSARAKEAPATRLKGDQRRIGLSPWWSLFSIVPLGTIVMLWIIAYRRWPKGN